VALCGSWLAADQNAVHHVENIVDEKVCRFCMNVVWFSLPQWIVPVIVASGQDILRKGWNFAICRDKTPAQRVY
jgi:hypothetical protein